MVQYRIKGVRKIRQVVPDNMVILHPEPIEAEESYDVPLQPVRPFWMLEYVSKSNKRKDYEDSRNKYEKELKVPYSLLFVPESQEMVLFRHNRRRYVTVVPDDNGRVAIPELELELGLLDGWVRFWFRGELVPLPAELVRKMDQLKQALARAEQRATQGEQRASQAEQRASQAEQRATQAEQDVQAEREARRALEEELARLRAERQGPPGSRG